MNHEFFEALALLEKEKGIPAEYLVEKIRNAISIAIKRDLGSEDNIVDIDPQNGNFYVAVRKTVVAEVEDPMMEITVEAARKYSKRAAEGDIVEIPLQTKEFGRIAAQSAKHVIRQGIREAEKGQLLAEFQSRQHDIVPPPYCAATPSRATSPWKSAATKPSCPRTSRFPAKSCVTACASRFMWWTWSAPKRAPV